MNTIFRGSDAEVAFVLKQKVNGVLTQVALNVGSTPDDIIVIFPGTSENVVCSLLTSSVVVTSDPRGEFKAVLDEAATLLLKKSTAPQNIVIKLLRSGETTIRELEKALMVQDQTLVEPE